MTKKLWVSSIAIVILLLLAGAFYWWQLQFLPVNSSSQQKVDFVIPPGQPAATTLTQLAQAKLIRSSLVAKIYLTWTNQDHLLRPGAYSLSPAQDLKKLLATFLNGPKDIWVTLPEGWRHEQMASRLKATFPAFDSTSYLVQAASLEGQLFPDTYLLPRDVTSDQILSLQQATFRKKVGQDLKREDLILASLVERESKANSDRPVIAGILLNRLKAGWPLQVDATVQYAADTANCQLPSINCQFWKAPINTKTLSSFNTYLHTGLPPRPICNPGLASIQAVLHPTATTYYYYLHDASGQPHYATTLTEHNQNIDKYLKL